MPPTTVFLARWLFEVFDPGLSRVCPLMFHAWKAWAWRLCVGFLLLGILAGCSPRVPSGGAGEGGTVQSVSKLQIAGNLPPSVAGARPSEVRTPSPFRFEEVAQHVGIDFLHHAPLTPERHAHLVYGSGIGWLDFDRDGWPDLYCCQGAAYRGTAPQREPSSPADPSDCLFLNRQGRFVNVTEAARLVEAGYSMGIAAADYDNDGFPDLCVTGYGENVLYHNQGDGTFTKQTLPHGESPGRMSASCAWADVDGDGNLDLYVANYAQLGPQNYPLCEHVEGGKKMYVVALPRLLQPLPDSLYRNCGDRRFADVSVSSGIASVPPQCGLGVVAADLDGDGDVDFYVSNDMGPNFLWENQGRGTFVDRGLEAGAAMNRNGACEAGMSLEAADFDGEGRLDLFVTNFFHETNTFYRNEGNLLFSDVTQEVGLGAPSKLRLGFGTCSQDFDRDGFLDLLVANGHVHDRLNEIGRDEPFAQLPLLFHNERGLRFSEVSADSGAYFTQPRVGRGAAAADFDRDGDVDVAVNHLNGPAALLRNDASPAGAWLQVELVGSSSNRDGVGAILQFDLGGQRLVRTRQAGSGYCSCGEERLTIGLGDATRIPRLLIRWPSGAEQVLEDLPVNRFLRLKEPWQPSAHDTARGGVPRVRQ